MSTVVGTCTDCIISVPNPNPLSLKYTVEVQQGINLIIKNKGSTSGYYPSNNQSVQHLQIAPSGTYNTGVPVTSLMIGTDNPLQVSIVRLTITTTFNVSQLMILDDSLTNVIIVNPSTTETANVFLAFSS